jgi:hypothetical protein
MEGLIPAKNLRARAVWSKLNEAGRLNDEQLLCH